MTGIGSNCCCDGITPLLGIFRGIGSRPGCMGKVMAGGGNAKLGGGKDRFSSKREAFFNGSEEGTDPALLNPGFSSEEDVVGSLGKRPGLRTL